MAVKLLESLFKNKFKLFIVFLMVLMIVPNVFSVGDAVTWGNALRITLYSQDPVQVEPGNYVELRFNIENLGENTLENFEVQVIPEFPFSLDPTEPSLKEYGGLGSGINREDGVVAKWKMRVADNAIEGDNDIRLRYRFKQGFKYTDWIYTDDFKVSVETQEVIFNIKDIQTIPSEVVPGQEFKLKINFENQADSSIRNIRFKLNLSDTFVTIGSTDEKYIKLLGPRNESTVEFKLLSKGDSDLIIYNLPLDITFYDNQGNLHKKGTSFGIILLDKPKLVKTIDSSKVYVSGDRGDVSVSISNVGVEEVKFVELNLLSSKDYRSISSENVYVGNIDSDDYESVTYDLYVNTIKKEVPLNFELKYQDSLNHVHIENITLSIPLYTRNEAKKLGLIQGSAFSKKYIGFVVSVFIIVFWFYMLIDVLRRKMPRYKRFTWLLILVLTTVFGSVLYYFMIKTRK